MAGARHIVIAGLLAVLALAPGALADCGFNHNGGSTTPPSFTTQTTASPPSPVAVAAFIFVPIGVIGGVLAVARSLAPKPAAGRWVATPTQWMWVEDPK